jgi:alkylhydroperoxidase family enzyme
VQQGMTEEMIASLVDVESAEITERERLAVRFAQRMATDHHSMDDGFFDELRDEFTDPEIFELGMITGQFIGYGRLISILDLENPDQPEIKRHEHDVVK